MRLADVEDITAESAEQAPPESTNEGVNRLMVRLKNRSGKVRIAVLFSPHWSDGSVVEDAEVKAIEKW